MRLLKECQWESIVFLAAVLVVVGSCNVSLPSLSNVSLYFVICVGLVREIYLYILKILKRESHGRFRKWLWMSSTSKYYLPYDLTKVSKILNIGQFIVFSKSA